MNKSIFKSVFKLAILAVDILIVYYAYLFAFYARFHWGWVLNIFPAVKGVPNIELYSQIFYLSLFIFGVIFFSHKFYANDIISTFDEFILILNGIFIGTLLVIAVTFIYRAYEYSRLVIGLGSCIAVVALFIWHIVIKMSYRALFTGIFGKQNVLVAGKAEQVDSIKRLMRKRRFMRPYFMLDYKDEKSFFDFVGKRNITEIFVAASFLPQEKLLPFADRCERAGIDFKVIPSVLQLCLGEVVIDNSLSLPVFHIKPVSLYGLNFYYKRVFDVLAAILMLAVISVPLIIISLLIKTTSPGGILYRHKRMGYRGKAFDFLKFRTMGIDADKRLEEIRHLTERDGPVFKMKNDPRITPIGKFLRRYSIDELPQLINVMRGEMSLVGPRPQVLWEAAAYDDFARRRLRVLPGITGLWQVSGRASLSYNEMIELDIYYIENWTLGLDLNILVKTISAVFSRKGAY